MSIATGLAMSGSLVISSIRKPGSIRKVDFADSGAYGGPPGA